MTAIAALPIITATGAARTASSASGRSGQGGGQTGGRGRGRDGFFRLLARGLALFLALYVSISLVALLLGNAYNLNTWWIDLHFLPSLVGPALQAVLALALFIFAIFSPSNFALRLAITITFLLFAIFAVVNAIEVFLTAAAGAIHLGFPIPFSLFIAVAFILLAIAALSKRHANSRPASLSSRLRTVIIMTISLVLAGALFPLGQVYCFGKTAYLTKVDAIAVLGAHAFPNGTLSFPLQDRVDSAIKAYEDGLCSVLIMTGGIDDDGTDEALAMRDYAVAEGVPAADIIMDNQGNSTEASARNVVRISASNNFERLGAVSSYYHMARIKMLFLANDHDIYTIPATPNLELEGSMHFLTAREIPGWWYYWFGNAFS